MPAYLAGIIVAGVSHRTLRHLIIVVMNDFIQAADLQPVYFARTLS